MAASGGSGGGPVERPWTAASNWAPLGGAAVGDAVSFETCEDNAEASPSAVVLARPPSHSGEDPTPCEVTVTFTGKYEIHRVYVRSTARIYEIYYSTDLKDTSKDYLCTVRCGLAAEESLPPGVESMSQSQCSSDASTGEKQEQETKSVASNSDEDSWVEVKIPGSPLANNTSESQERNVIGSSQKNTLAHYEATAEITAASPCVSLTVRLLSLQPKTSVHIEEIYIFADPVESTSDDLGAGPGNMGGSSFLAMLVPGLMQMSKSRNSKIDDRYFSDGRTQLPEGCALEESSQCGKIAQDAGLYGRNDSKSKSSGLESRLPPADCAAISNGKNNQDEFPLSDTKSLPLPVQTTENTQIPSVKDQRVSNTDQHANPLTNENFASHNRIETMLDTLLSKVEKMELYYSRFEGNMMRPLGSIEARLERLEQQFNSFSVEIQSLRGSSTRMSAPDGLSDTTNSQDRSHNDGTSASITNRQPGLVIRAPEFSVEDSCCIDVADQNPVNLSGPNVMPGLFDKAPSFVFDPELTCEKLHDAPFRPVELVQSSERERKTSPGLALKVPDFPNDDDEEEGEDKQAEAGDHDGQTKSDDTLRKSTIDSSKSKTRVSIDGALASALDAFLASTKGTSLSESVACGASNSSAENSIDSSNCSLSPEQVDKIPTKDGSVSQFHGAFGDANKVGTSISYEEINAALHTSPANLVGKVEVNEQNIDLYSDKMAFASTEPFDVPSQPHIVSIDDGTQVNGRNNYTNLDTTPSVINSEPLDDPSSPSTILGSVDDGIQAKEKPPTVLESVDVTAQVNENRPALSLAEFLAARDATSDVCRGNDGTGILSLERTSAGGRKNSEGGDSKASQKNTIVQLLLLKKALEADDDSKSFDDISIDTTFEASSYVTPANGANRHCMNAAETVTDETGGLEYTGNSIRLPGGMDSVFFQFSDSKKRWIENSSLDSGLNGSLMKPKVEHSWSDLSSMESFGGAPAREAGSLGNTMTGDWMQDFFAGTGANSNVIPVSGEELQDVYDLLSMTFVANRTNKSSPSLEVLLGESSDSETQLSDLEDIDKDAGFGSSQLFSTFSSSDDDTFASNEPLVDVPVQSEVHASAANEPLVDVVDLTDPSWTSAPSVNEPLVDVVDLPGPSWIYAPSANETFADVADLPELSKIYDPATDKPLFSADDLPIPETFAEESSGEHPDSLI